TSAGATDGLRERARIEEKVRNLLDPEELDVALQAGRGKHLDVDLVAERKWSPDRLRRQRRVDSKRADDFAQARSFPEAQLQARGSQRGGDTDAQRACAFGSHPEARDGAARWQCLPRKAERAERGGALGLQVARDADSNASGVVRG